MTAQQLPPSPTATARGSYRWRTATPEDAEAVHSVASSAGELDHPYFTIPLEEVVEDLRAVALGEGGGAIVAVDADEHVVAYGIVVPFSLDGSPIVGLMLGAVAPHVRGLGLGSEIMRWQRDFGFDWLRSVDPSGPRRLLAYVDEQAKPARALFAASGFDVAREYLHLCRGTSDLLQAALPDGYRLSPLTSSLSPAVRDLRNEAFRDQWSAHSFEPEAWDAYVARPVMDQVLSRVVLDEAGEVVGYIIVEHGDAENGGGSAYVASLGVAASHRSRGIASALLAELVSAARERGLSELSLDVDSDSDSRANELYFRLGFEVSHRRFSYISERSG